jgi:hypothetical protein
VEDHRAHETWIVRGPDGQLRMVTPADRAAAAERAISDGWEEIAAEGDFDRLVRWVLQVGDDHGWPLDEDWVRHTFADLASQP